MRVSRTLEGGGLIFSATEKLPLPLEPSKEALHEPAGLVARQVAAG